MKYMKYNICMKHNTSTVTVWITRTKLFYTEKNVRKVFGVIGIHGAGDSAIQG